MNDAHFTIKVFIALPVVASGVAMATKWIGKPWQARCASEPIRFALLKMLAKTAGKADLYKQLARLHGERY